MTDSQTESAAPGMGGAAIEKTSAATSNSKAIIPLSDVGIKFTRITSRRPKTLTKQYRLEGGELRKGTVANMVSGEAERLQVVGAAGFADVLARLDHNQALCYGTPDVDQAPVYSRAEFERRNRPTDAITRTKDNFSWPHGAGVFMIDYDPEDGTPPLSRSDLQSVLAEVVPGFEQAARVWWPSSSSLIYREQEQLAGIKGQRFYVFVADATDAERAGAVLFKRLWLAGHGHYAVSRAGSALERAPVDASVWQSNRLDFAAGAECSPPLEQRRGAPEVYDGGLLNTAVALPDLTQEEEAQLEAAKAKARHAVEPDIQQARQQYIEAEAAKLAERAGVPVADEHRDTVARAAQQGVLAGDFVISLEDGTTVSVGEVLDNPAKYHGKLTLDPLEPEYGSRKVVGKLYLIGARPNLYSFAHGGRDFRLIRQPRRIEHRAGHTHETVGATLEYLRQLPDFFDMGSELVHVSDGKAHVLDFHRLAYRLGGVAQYWRWNITKKETVEQPIDPPQQVLNQLLALGAGRRLKPLKAVITAPVIDTGGNVVERVGYNAATQLYLDLKDDPPAVPAAPTKEQINQARDKLLAPFKDFATAEPVDHAVMVAGILTAIQRPALPTAPGFGADAPVQGTGKTYLAMCVGALASGRVPSVRPHVSARDDEETRKRLFAALLEGNDVLVWDNILGIFDSAAIASFLTSTEYGDRVLGKSREGVVPNRLLLLLTGNNMSLAGDMPRRVLKCRLDAGVENPATRKFDSDPLAYILRNRLTLVQAGLTLIRGYLQSSEYRNGGAVPNETTASFEDWDTTVRQVVAWLGFEDPGEAIKDAVANDPEKEALSDLLEGIEAVMGNGWFETKDLYAQIEEAYGFPDDLYAMPERRALLAVLQDVSGKRLTSRGLGRILSFRVGRRVGGRAIEKQPSTNRTKFRVQNHGLTV